MAKLSNSKFGILPDKNALKQSLPVTIKVRMALLLLMISPIEIHLPRLVSGWLRSINTPMRISHEF